MGFCEEAGKLLRQARASVFRQSLKIGDGWLATILSIDLSDENIIRAIQRRTEGKGLEKITPEMWQILIGSQQSSSIKPVPLIDQLLEGGSPQILRFLGEVYQTAHLLIHALGNERVSPKALDILFEGLSAADHQYIHRRYIEEHGYQITWTNRFPAYASRHTALRDLMSHRALASLEAATL